jgi:gliding motility-associated-like protein
LLPDTTHFCYGDVSHLRVTQKYDKIQWINPHMGGIIENTNKIPVIQKGKYYVKTVYKGVTTNDSTYVMVHAKPRLNLSDTVLCRGQQLLLDAMNPGMKYLWSTGETTQKIRVESSGNYWIRVNNGGCMQYDTISVKFIPGSVPNFNGEVTFCLSEENKMLSIKPAANAKILWSTGSVYPSIKVTKEGTYWVKTENKNCGEQIDSVSVKLKACDCEMLIPNSFTPNEDNKNDYFFPVVQCEYTFYTMTITDKWGNIVFFTNNVNGKWDGRFKGNLCPEEVYVYRIESIEKGSDKKLPRMGKVSLFR